MLSNGMIIKQWKCTSCSFTFAIAEEVAEAVCPRCGEPVIDPALKETSSAAPAPLTPSPPDPLPAAPAPLTPSPPDPLPAAPAPLTPSPSDPLPAAPEDPAPEDAVSTPSFSPPEETPASEAKPALGRLALKKQALPRADPRAGPKSAKKSRYDDSAIRGKRSDISNGSPPARQNAGSPTEAPSGAESPPVRSPGEVERPDDEDSDYLAMECEPLEVGDMVVMDEGEEPALPRFTTPPPPMPDAPTLPPPSTDDFEWQPLPVDFQPPSLAEEPESASLYDFDLQPSSAAEELTQSAPFTAMEPLSLDQTEPSGYEERFHQAAAGGSPADSLTPLPVFESAMETAKKPVATGPGIKVVVPLMPVEEVQLGGKRPALATPAPEPARKTGEREPARKSGEQTVRSSAHEQAITPPLGKIQKHQGKEAPRALKTNKTKEKIKPKKKKWWFF